MTWLVVATGYVFGSIPTAFLAGRWLLGKDIRKLGDGNSGARNAFFQISPKAGVYVKGQYYRALTSGAANTISIGGGIAINIGGE